MPGKTARALCPVCQEPMPPDETECDNCGAFVIDEAVVRLSRAFGIPREKALALFDKGFRHPKQLKDRDVDDVLEKGEVGLLFLCTNCGGFVATGDAKCHRCGAEFEPEAPKPAEEKDILDLVLCPVCGADNDPDIVECEICGEPLHETESVPKPAAEAMPAAPAPEASPGLDAPPSPGFDPLTIIDDILNDLDKPARGEAAAAGPHVEPRVTATVPTKAVAEIESPPIPEVQAPVEEPSIPASEAVARPAAPPPSPPLPVPSEPPGKASLPRPHTVRLRRSEKRRTIRSIRSRLWSPPAPEFTGGMTVAAAGILVASAFFLPVGIAWAVDGGLLLLALYALPPVLARRRKTLRWNDALLLAAGAGLGLLAPWVASALAVVVAAAAAIPLALATRSLLRTSARDLIAAASAVAMVGPATALALGVAAASGPAWIIGLAAAVPWPGAVAWLGFRIRRATAARDRELTQAERDLLRQDYSESVRDFDRAIEAGGKDAPGAELPWYGKGATLILLGRYEEALRAIDTALDLNPRNEVAWLNKGNALTKMGRLVDALRCFNAALRVNPRYEVAWNNKGNALARLGNNGEALACYERALALDPDYRAAWVNKGYVLTRLGRYDEATACADRALRLSRAPRAAPS